MHTINVQIVTPAKVHYDAQALQVNLPGQDGEFGVLFGHMPLVASLKPGVITVELENKQVECFAICDGFADITSEKCIILVEEAYTSGEDSSNLETKKSDLETAIEIEANSFKLESLQKSLETIEHAIAIQK